MWNKLIPVDEIRRYNTMLKCECFYLGALVKEGEIRAVSVLKWGGRSTFLCVEIYPQVTATHFLLPISK